MSGNCAAFSAGMQDRSGGVLPWMPSLLCTSAVDVQLLGLEGWQ